MNIVQYLSTANVVVVLFLAIANFSAIRAFRRRSFTVVAFGWLLHLAYLALAIGAGSLFDDVRSIAPPLLALLNVAASSLFWLARCHDRRPPLLVGMSIIATAAVLIAVVAPAQYSAVLDVVVATLGFAALGAFYRDVLSGITDRRGNVPVAALGAFAYALLQPAWLAADSRGTTALALIFVLAIVAKALVAYGLQSAFITAAATGASIRAAASTVGRVTHELGTPIAQIALYVDQLRNLFRDHDVAAQDKVLASLENATLRVKAVLSATAQLLPNPDQIIDLDAYPSLGREGASTPHVVVNINTVVQLAVMAVKETRGERVVMSVDYSPNCCVRCSPHEVAQALINLLRNAYDAIPPGGAGRVRVQTLASGSPDRGTVEVRITDDGEGIRADVAAHVFDEGFTTRSGAGRGFGLVVVKSIVARYGGQVTLVPAQERGSGTVATVKLPRERCV